MPDLASLQAVVQAMSAGPWTHINVTPENVDGIIALRNAADWLLEIARGENETLRKLVECEVENEKMRVELDRWQRATGMSLETAEATASAE